MRTSGTMRQARAAWHAAKRVLATAGVAALLGAAAAQDSSGNITWPRVFEKDGKRLTVYQPQVDSWKDYRQAHFRCAIAVEGVLKDETYGVAETDATTVVDQASRMVAVTPVKRELRFAGVSPGDTELLRSAVAELNPTSHVTILSLDCVLACLDASKQSLQKEVPVNLAPPRIYHSSVPAILVNCIGKPRLEPVVRGGTDLQFVVNTNWDLLFDTQSSTYYLLDGDGWLSAPDLMAGPWSVARSLPPSFASLPADDNWAEARKNLPGKPAAATPVVYVSTQPAEMVLTEGAPQFTPVPGTKLSSVRNTDSVLFRDAADGNFYLLVAGRWFRAADLDGPWAAASSNLPADFANIPDGDPAEFVKSCVPRTEEAQDAVLLASVPNTTTVKLSEQPVAVTWSGDPKFASIPGTQVQYGENTAFSVFLVDGTCYCCDQGVWFSAATPMGPWAFCTQVPDGIYALPPSSPHYNDTYVTVQGSSDTTATYCQTSGYSGEYVATNGVLVFGAGMPAGTADTSGDTSDGSTDSDDSVWYPPYPCYYSYGCGAMYHYGYGGYYGAGYACYGPYGGAGYAAAYNPATGTYGRAAYAYGPYGSTATRAAYNPYTGATAAATRTTTASGTTARAAGYNPATGTYARSAYASGRYGSAGAVTTSQGTGAAAWKTPTGQGAVAKTKSGDVYASNGDTVYKREPDGSWSSNSGNGWQNANKPRPAGEAEPTRVAPGAESHAAASQVSGGWSPDAEARSRDRGNQQTELANQFRSSGGAASQRTMGGGRRGR